MAVTITALQLAERIAGAANDADVAAQLLATASALVEREAPNAPEAIQNAAVIRFAGYLSQSDFGTIRMEEIGPRRVEYITNHAAMFRNCGAKALLSPWKIRRAGLIENDTV